MMQQQLSRCVRVIPHGNTLWASENICAQANSSRFRKKKLPVKGGKGSNAKKFTQYYEIQFAHHERTGAFLVVPVLPKQVFPAIHAFTEEEYGTTVWKGALAHKDDLGAKNNSDETSGTRL